MIKEYCDRCKKEIGETNQGIELMSHSEGEYPNPIGTLCEDCEKNFDNWWERKEARTKT